MASAALATIQAVRLSASTEPSFMRFDLAGVSEIRRRGTTRLPAPLRPP